MQLDKEPRKLPPRRGMENYLDMTHFAFAHSSSLGLCADPRIRDRKITTHPDGGYQMDAPFPALETTHELQGKLQSAHQRLQRSFPPAFGPSQSRPGFKGPPAEKQVEFPIGVLDEDRRMCELQSPREIPINPGRGGWGVLVTPGDTLANTFQKQLRRWLLAQVDPGAVG